MVRKIYWLFSYMFEAMDDWLIDCLVDWLFDWLIDWLIECSVDWLRGWFIDYWFAGHFCGWWPVEWHAGCLGDVLVLNDRFPRLSTSSDLSRHLPMCWGLLGIHGQVASFVRDEHVSTSTHSTERHRGNMYRRHFRWSAFVPMPARETRWKSQGSRARLHTCHCLYNTTRSSDIGPRTTVRVGFEEALLIPTYCAQLLFRLSVARREVLLIRHDFWRALSGDIISPRVQAPFLLVHDLCCDKCI